MSIRLLQLALKCYLIKKSNCNKKASFNCHTSKFELIIQVHGGMTLNPLSQTLSGRI